MAAVILMAYLWAGDLATFPGDSVTPRIIFWHVPMAMVSIAWFAIAAFYSGRYLVRSAGPRPPAPSAGESAAEAPVEPPGYRADPTSDRRFDDTRASLAAEMGLLLTVLATVTGSIFSKMQWAGGLNSPWYHGWWQWDPKQTAIVVVILIFAAYFGLRMSVEDSDLRARLSGAYAILGCVAVPFLYWVLPHIPALQSSHPTDVIRSGMDTAYRTTFWMSTAGFLGISLWGYQLKVRLAAAAERRAGWESAADTPRIEAVRLPVAER